MPTRAGPEIGVASTKAFTAQLTVLISFAVALLRRRVPSRRSVLMKFKSKLGAAREWLVSQYPRHSAYCA